MVVVEVEVEVEVVGRMMEEEGQEEMGIVPELDEARLSYSAMQCRGLPPVCLLDLTWCLASLQVMANGGVVGGWGSCGLAGPPPLARTECLIRHYLEEGTH